MKEADWLRCADPSKMLAFVKGRKAPVRRARLFAAACCRRAWPDLEARTRAAVEALERFAEGPGKQADKNELKAAWQTAGTALAEVEECSRPYWARRAVCNAAEPTEAWWAARAAAERWLDAVESSGGAAARARESLALAGLVRDVFGNPCRPTSIDPPWRTPATGSLAQAAYDERILPGGELDPRRLVVLADALEEAGAGAELLAHLRGPGPHVRGCWVVDLLAARS
jgi:hypothetical protein